MSRTWKDRPYRLGGNRHGRYCCVSNHGSHGKFTRLMRRLTRAFLKREVRMDPDSAQEKSHYQKDYYD